MSSFSGLMNRLNGVSHKDSLVLEVDGSKVQTTRGLSTKKLWSPMSARVRFFAYGDGAVEVAYSRYSVSAAFAQLEFSTVLTLPREELRFQLAKSNKLKGGHAVITLSREDHDAVGIWLDEQESSGTLGEIPDLFIGTPTKVIVGGTLLAGLAYAGVKWLKGADLDDLMKASVKRAERAEET